MASGFRCTACGNRTRFDVVSTRQTRAFWHFTLGGELNIDEEDVLEDRVESVSCRWCGSSVIETIGDPSEAAVSEQGSSPVH